ncbi:MAG: tail fiber protein [Parafilimonas terrae]|nr:tail fiber protein [Parafilimonas terrae]
MAAVVAAVAAGGGGSSGGVPTSRNVNAAGLATGGGPLSSDVTITVPAAAQSDVATGTDQTKALTSFSVAAALGAKAPLASPAFVGAATFASGSAQYATAISILPSTFTTSRRSALSFGDWALVQDASGNGTKDFGIYNGPIGSFPIYINTTGIVAFNQPPTAPTPSVGDNTTKLATTAFATALAVPSGAVMHFAMSSCPAAWLKANSAAVSRSTYSGLFAAIGTTFGAGDGSTTFNLPDLRGEFIRGFDDGRGVDSGRALGSFQAQQIQNHTHNTSYDVVAAAGSGARAPSDNFNNVSATSNPTSGGGTETRPRNVALLACIKS